MAERNVIELLADTADGVFAVDLEGRILLWNRSAERITGRRATEVMGKLCCDVMRGRDPAGNAVCMNHCHIQTMAVRGDPPFSYDLLVSHSDGSPRWLNISTVLIRDEDREPKAVVHLFRDVTYRRELETLLKGTLGQHLPSSHTPPAGIERLTPREREVLMLMASGVDSQAMADRLSISHATVRNHIQNILTKLGVHSQLAAVALAHRHGLAR